MHTTEKLKIARVGLSLGVLNCISRPNSMQLLTVCKKIIRNSVQKDLKKAI